MKKRHQSEMNEADQHQNEEVDDYDEVRSGSILPWNGEEDNGWRWFSAGSVSWWWWIYDEE